MIEENKDKEPLNSIFKSIYRISTRLFQYNQEQKREAKIFEGYLKFIYEENEKQKQIKNFSPDNIINLVINHKRMCKSIQLELETPVIIKYRDYILAKIGNIKTVLSQQVINYLNDLGRIYIENNLGILL